MSLLASRSRFGNIVGLAVVGILGHPGIGLGGAPPTTVPPPSLATAAEMLSQRKLRAPLEVHAKLAVPARVGAKSPVAPVDRGEVQVAAGHC